jgi:hypothetical protein
MVVQENPQAVQNWIDWLNKTTDSTWIAMNGFTALTVVTIEDNGTVTFNPNSGFPLKSFLNTQTGEVRSFSAHKFYV